MRAVSPPKKLDEIAATSDEDLRRVERVLREGTRSVSPLVSEIGSYTLAGGGKRIRPLLVLLAARLCGYRGPRAIQVAAAAELLHTATLVHDDVVDGADLRRGRPSVNAEYGLRLAILVGDFLYATSSQLLIEEGNGDILASFSEAIRKMAEGEVLQLARSFDPEISESTYLDVIGRKTASLLATASEAGAILGEVTRLERRSLRAYGWQLGLAFQLVDDALDFVSTGEELGKVPLADLAEGKVTLPLIATLKRCTSSERDVLLATLKSFSSAPLAERSSVDRDQLRHVAACVARYRGAEFALDRAAACAAEARAKIEAFVESEAKQALLDLTYFVVQRRN